MKRRAPEETPVIVGGGYARTPFARASNWDKGEDGAMGMLRSDDLAALTIRHILNSDPVRLSGMKRDDIHEVIIGCAFPEGPNGLNVARMTAVLEQSGLNPLATGGTTVNKFCGSAMYALAAAARAIASGDADSPVYLAGGVENMSINPGMIGFKPDANPRLPGTLAPTSLDMAYTAENLAARYKIGREGQARFAVQSHLKASEAQRRGWFAGEIVPVPVISNGSRKTVWFDGKDGPEGLIEYISEDDCIQTYPDEAAGMATMAGLSPIKKGHTITAGTASPYTDGAAFMLVTSRAYAEENGLPIQAEILSCAESACAPDVMGIGPVEASCRALKKAGVSWDEADVIEFNEAFAPQVLAVTAELEKRGMSVDFNKLNICGGALAIGHPLGASGARLIGTGGRLLEKRGGGTLLAAMCVGGGMGVAAVLRR